MKMSILNYFKLKANVLKSSEHSGLRSLPDPNESVPISAIKIANDEVIKLQAQRPASTVINQDYQPNDVRLASEQLHMELRHHSNIMQRSICAFD